MGQPCSRGHFPVEHTITGECRACARLRWVQRRVWCPEGVPSRKEELALLSPERPALVFDRTEIELGAYRLSPNGDSWVLTTEAVPSKEFPDLLTAVRAVAQRQLGPQSGGLTAAELISALSSRREELFQQANEQLGHIPPEQRGRVFPRDK
jgi:hypothetical protein